MLKIAIAFTNFGPYHLARLRALGERLSQSGGELIAYELAGKQELYPWKTTRGSEPFEWITLFPDGVMEDLSKADCDRAMTTALGIDQPDAVGVVGYFRPESLAMLRWAKANHRPSVMMSESQEIDHPRVWWKEAVKRRRIAHCSAGLVGGVRHRDYLESLGMPRHRIALGYNAVDGVEFAAKAEAARLYGSSRLGLPSRPYFVAVNRFAPEKNLPRLIEAYRRYRLGTESQNAWDLVLCGDGPGRAKIDEAIGSSGFSESIHTPGFLQADELPRWLAFASAFVHPATSEPWGLVVNEAAASGLPLLVSERAGAVETFVPEQTATAGRRFNPFDVDAMASALAEMSKLSPETRRSLGENALAIALEWGPERFAEGALQAFELAFKHEFTRNGRTMSLAS